MTIHNTLLRTADARPENIGKLDASSGMLASSIYGENGWPPPNVTNADLRDAVMSTTNCVELRRAEDDPFGVRIEEILADGRVAIAHGQCFDLGKTADITDLLPRQPNPALLPALIVPYITTVVSITFDDEPWLFVLKSDDHGRLVEILVVTLHEKEGGYRPFVAVKALIGVHRLDDGEPAPIIHVDAGRWEIRQIHGHLWLTWTSLSLINDDRLALRRDIVPAKLNAARTRRGKAALPDLWRLDISAVAYTTTIARHVSARTGRYGSTHKSPVTHTRRAHLRKLRSGRAVFVRDCRVGEALRHLRTRAFYQV